MSHSRHISELAGGERGAVLVMFALFAPVAIILAAFTIDAGSWFLHKRHLQVQADAGALAAAQAFQPCLNEAIYKLTGQYGGAGSVSTPEGTVNSTTPLYNVQTAGTSPSNIHEMINSQKYFDQSSPVDTTASTQPPCTPSNQMVDVKLTETGLPWYFRPIASIIKVVPYINAHARVEILQENVASKVEPLTIADTAPVAAAAYFVDEDNNNAELKKTALSDLGPNKEGQEICSNASAPVELAVNHPHIGVVIALSGNKSDTTCGDPDVECFGRKTEAERPTLQTAEALLHIAGYANAGTGTLAAPLARQVTLSNPAPVRTATSRSRAAVAPFRCPRRSTTAARTGRESRSRR
jgi:Flp pilus assembly protein TadG